VSEEKKNSSFGHQFYDTYVILQFILNFSVLLRCLYLGKVL